jgi:hypothetical protein
MLISRRKVQPWSRFIQDSAGSAVTRRKSPKDASAGVCFQQQRGLSSKQASELMLDECGHPRHRALHLKVSSISGCDGFVPAAQA